MTVAFSPDGKRVLSGGQENSAHLWNLTPSLDDSIERIDLALRVDTGMTLDDDGSLRVLDNSGWNECRARMRTLAR